MLAHTPPSHRDQVCILRELRQRGTRRDLYGILTMLIEFRWSKEACREEIFHKLRLVFHYYAHISEAKEDHDTLILMNLRMLRKR
jgi:hypothetical protein